MKLTSLFHCATAATALSLPRTRGRANDPSYRFVGRVNPETQELTWPSTGVAFTFAGTTASIKIDDVSGTSSLDLTIDDGEPILIDNFDDSIISTPNLPNGTHSVELRKRSESVLGTLRITDVTTDGTFLESAAPERKIEIIGDSISVGYGLDGVLPCTDSAVLQNNGKTYGAVAARAFGADYSVVAWSGKGLIRNYASTPPDPLPAMPALYTRYGAFDEDGSFPFPSSWVPDAVVINLGTNDFSYLDVREPVDPADLTDAVVALVESIHSHYSEAQFFLVSSPMLNDDYPTEADAQKSTHVRVLEQAMEQLEGVETHFVDWPSQGSELGCDYHPNEDTHSQGAALLEDAIRSALGW